MERTNAFRDTFLFSILHFLPWSGVTYRRVITTVVYSDGTSQSTAQDYVYDKRSDRWIVFGLPFDYRGPGVAPAGPPGCLNGGCGDKVIGDFIFYKMDERLVECIFKWFGCFVVSYGWVRKLFASSTPVGFPNLGRLLYSQILWFMLLQLVQPLPRLNEKIFFFFFFGGGAFLPLFVLFAADNVLRMDEFLLVGHGIFSIDREFMAVLESDCNFVVRRTRGLGEKRAKV